MDARAKGLNRAMFEHLRGMEIEAELVEKEPGRSDSDEWIKVSRQNFDEVKILSRVRGREDDLMYWICYVIRCPMAAMPSRLDTRTEPIRERRFWRPKVKGVKWKGGTLSEWLNIDTDLLHMLLETGQTDVRIRSNRKDGCVEIVGQPYWFAAYAGRHLPHSRRVVEAYDRIAKHVRGAVGR